MTSNQQAPSLGRLESAICSSGHIESGARTDAIAGSSQDSSTTGSDDEQSLIAAINEGVSLRAHDPAWASAFEGERDRLQALRPDDFLAIEHIGSTAVAGLPAKPVVDILAGIATLAGVDELVDFLCDHGYTTSREFNATLADRKWLMRWRDGHRTHHLHLVVHDGAQWHDRLAFRDALRRDPALAARYATLKADLATRHASDRDAYTAAKGDFVRAVLANMPTR